MLVLALTWHTYVDRYGRQVAEIDTPNCSEGNKTVWRLHEDCGRMTSKPERIE